MSRVVRFALSFDVIVVVVITIAGAGLIGYATQSWGIGLVLLMTCLSTFTLGYAWGSFQFMDKP